MGKMLRKANLKTPTKYLTPNQRLKLARQSIFSGTFAGLSRLQSQQLRQLILANINRQASLSDIMEAAKKIADLTESQLESIIRTERHEILMTIQEQRLKLLDPEDENLYTWLGPSDSRTSAVCKSIKRRTGNGVHLDTLKQIVEEEATKHNPKWVMKDWTPHPSCRHTISRFYR